MNHSLVKSKLLTALSILLVLPLISFSQVKKEKIFNETVKMSTFGTIDIQHRRGPLTIKESSDSEVKIESTIKVTGKDIENVDLALELLNIEVEQSADHLQIKSGQEIKQWNTNAFNRSKITFANGGRVEDIKDIEIALTVYLPKLRKINLTNKYDNIYYQTLSGDVTINLHDGEVEGGAIEGDLQINAKYSDGSIGNITGVAIMDLHDSDIVFGSSQKLTVDMKYSDCSFGETGSADLDIHDSEVKLKSLNGPSKINDKYSEIEMDDCPQLTLSLHDSEFEFGKIDELNIVTKYSGISGSNVTNLTINAHDDNVRIHNASTATIESKYTEFEFNNIASQLHFVTYDDDLIAGSFGSDLTKVYVNGKYTDIQLNMTQNTSYELKVKSKYGSFEYEESLAQTNYYKEKNGELEINAKIGTGSDFKLAEFDIYDCDVIIK